MKGKIEGINPASPFYQYKGYNYLISGTFSGAGALNIDVLKVASGDPGTCGGGCVADDLPVGCDSGCLSAVNSGGKLTVSLQPHLTGTIGSYPNISTTPTMKLVFNDPGGSLSLTNLSGSLSSLSAVQFPSLALSGNSGSDTWTPTVSTYSLNYTPPSGSGGGGGTPVPVMEGWWLLPGALAGIGMFAHRRKE